MVAAISYHQASDTDWLISRLLTSKCVLGSHLISVHFYIFLLVSQPQDCLPTQETRHYLHVPPDALLKAVRRTLNQ